MELHCLDPSRVVTGGGIDSRARVEAMPMHGEPCTSPAAKTPITHAHVCWWSFLLVIGFCAVISTLVSMVNGSDGSDLLPLLKTITCIGLVCWGLDQGVIADPRADSLVDDLSDELSTGAGSSATNCRR